MSRWRRAVTAGALGIAAVILVWYAPKLRRPFSSNVAMNAVIAASEPLTYRPSLARLSGNFPYRETKPRPRGDGDARSDPALSQLWDVIARFRKETESDSAPRRHALAVSYLLAGMLKPAVQTLEDALRTETKVTGDIAEAIRRSRDAALLNDIAVAYETVAEQSGDQKATPLALEAAQRAWTIDKTPQIAWTRAVVIESHHVREASIAAWHDYLALEPRSEWSTVARQRLNDLSQPADRDLWPAVRGRLMASRESDSATLRNVDRFRQEVRLWCEDELLPQWGEAVLKGDSSAPAQLARIAILGAALDQANGEREVADAVDAIRNANPAALRQLARGHAAYGASRAADRNSRVAESIREMDASVAALTPELTPFAWRARVEHAGMVYMSNDYPRVLTELSAIPAASVRLSNSCKGMIHALIGIVDLQTGSYKEAADHYASGVELFRSAGERDTEATLLTRLAEALDKAGDSVHAHSYRQQALEIFNRTGDQNQRHHALYGAALAAIDADQQADADLFLNALVSNDVATGSHVRTCTSLMWRGAYRYHRGLADSAAVDLNDAERVCHSIEDRSLRERALANLELAKSALGSDASSTAPLTGLDDAIRYYQKTGSHVWLRTAYFARARRLSARGELAAAECDFQAALADGDLSRDKIDERQLRISFTATADTILDGYVNFLLAQHRNEDAFEAADRKRVRELVDSPTARWRSQAGGASLRDIQASLPLDSVLIEYRVIGTKIVAWVISSNAFAAVALPVSISQITPAITAAESGTSPEAKTNAAFLYDVLIRPIAPLLSDSKTLIVVPDDELERVAYSALYDRVLCRYVVEMRATVVAPSAALFVESRRRSAERSTYHDRMIIAQAVSAGSNLPALPEAAAESRSIARLYRDSQIIDVSNTTGHSLLTALNEGTLLQFTGHTVIDTDPTSRTLRLGESRDATLRMADIAGAPLPKLRLVYLSACETDSGPILKSEGSLTIARSFFAAGVPVVVGTLWPIDDTAARLAAHSFHEHLQRGNTPAESLRQAQLDLLQRGSQYRDWATLRIIGAGL
jgi:CHAT domain-containing protein/tetratricopeptide (TPR) repeat protein